MSWFSRVKNAVNARRLDADLAEEMRDHLERRTAAFEGQGFTSEEARRQAQLRFGNVTRLHEESREFRLWLRLEGTLMDLRYAWRGMRKGPAFAVTAVLSLGLAIAANTAIYSIVDAAIVRPLPVWKPHQLFILEWPDIQDPGAPAGAERDTFSYPEYVRFASAAKSTARLGFFGPPLRVEARGPEANARVEKINKAFVSGEGFDMLGVRPMLGRLFSAEEDKIPPSHAVAVISYDYWGRRFHHDPEIAGRKIEVEGKQFEIAGVAQKGFFGVEPGAFIDVWIPGSQYEAQAFSQPGWHWFHILGRFAPGISAAQVQAQIQPSFHDFQVQLVKRDPTMPAAVRKQFLQSVIHVHPAASGVSDFRKNFGRSLWIVFGVAVVILLIACSNVASLLLARSTARAAEMAMRVSLGASRLRLVRQMLTESLLLFFMGGGVGWVLARVAAPLLVAALSKEDDPLQLMLATDTRVLLFCSAVSAIAAILFGLAPAAHISSLQPMSVMRGSSGQAGKLRLGKLFVSVQVACAFCLVLVGSAFLFSLNNLLHVDPGFDARNMAVLGITADEPQKSADPVAWIAEHRNQELHLRNLMFQLQTAVASRPGVLGAAIAHWPIFQGGGWSQQVIIPGHAPSETEEILYRVSPGYFATMRTRLLAGRDFRPEDSNAQMVVPAIVNEAFARKYFQSLDVVGREFGYPSERGIQREVIAGVAADAHYYDLRGAADPIVYLPMEGNNSFTIYVRSQLPLGDVVRVVSREARAIGSAARVNEITDMETIVGNTLKREKLLAGLGGAFAFFGLLLAAIGLFGLLNYSVGRRTREIGIRAALGARRSEIVALILSDAGGLVSGGVLMGLTAALFALMLFRSLLFGIRTADPLVIGTAIGIFAGTGLVAAYLPARHAASIDPISALREE